MPSSESSSSADELPSNFNTIAAVLLDPLLGFFRSPASLASEEEESLASAGPPAPPPPPVWLPVWGEGDQSPPGRSGGLLGVPRGLPPPEEPACRGDNVNMFDVFVALCCVRARSGLFVVRNKPPCLLGASSPSAPPCLLGASSPSAAEDPLIFAQNPPPAFFSCRVLLLTNLRGE